MRVCPAGKDKQVEPQDREDEGAEGAGKVGSPVLKAFSPGGSRNDEAPSGKRRFAAGYRFLWNRLNNSLQH